MSSSGSNAQGASEALLHCNGDVEDALDHMARYLQVVITKFCCTVYLFLYKISIQT